MNRRVALPVLMVTVLLGACIEHENLVLPRQDETARVFRRYVSMGNSLTAGWMSGGINDSTQRLAYPVLLAELAEAGFAIPSLAMPGCPPPLVGAFDIDSTGAFVLEEDRVQGCREDWCSLRSQPIPQFVQNVAVPGARMADAYDIDRPGNSANALTTLLLGGFSQVEAMRRAQPSLVTSWLGNNDVLEGALEGDLSLMTPVDTFAVYAGLVAANIAGAAPVGVVIIGVIDVTLVPVLQPGLYFWVADSLGFAPKPVSADCAPTDTAGALNPLSMNTVSFLAYTDSLLAEVSCDPSAPYVLTPQEENSVQERVDAFNDILMQQADARQWIFVNSTSELLQAIGTTGRNRLRQCNFLDNSDTLDDIVATVIAQCPHESAPNFFGSLVSYDGVHMSAQAHEILAEVIADELSSRFELDL